MDSKTPATRVVRVNAEHPEPVVIEEAAAIIRSGGLVAFPTETVYGLGADAANPDAVRRLYLAKGRPDHKPVLVLIADRSWLPLLTSSAPHRVTALMDAFWPGPLTLTLPAAPGVVRALLGGGTTIGVRYPGPSVAQTLTRAVGRPITAPSANRSGGPNPLSAGAVIADLRDRIDLVVDGGPARQPVPSTIVDASVDPPGLIRPGRIRFEEILQVWTHAAHPPDRS